MTTTGNKAGSVSQRDAMTTPQPAPAPRFANVSCSQCGKEFGPGDSGFSHCENHPPYRDRWTGLDALTRTEIMAEAFRVMTGHMAPYKDASPESYPASHEERNKAFDEWSERYGQCVRAVMHAFKEYKPTYGDDDE